MSDGPPPPPPGQPGPPGWGGQPPQPPPGYAQQPPPQYYGPYVQPPKTDGTAIAVLVLSICSVAFITLCPFVLAIVALCLAPGAKRNIAQSGGTITGEGLVKAGVIISWISIGLAALGAAIIIIIVIAAASSNDSNNALALMTPLFS